MTLNYFCFSCIIIFLFLIKNLIADLPVHCLKNQIIGRWIIKASNLMKVKSGYEMRCGHKIPSNKETSWKAQSIYPLLNEYEVDLSPFDVAHLNMNGSSKNGFWTMVYDEGINLEFEDLTFFTFFKYSYEIQKNNLLEKSYCYSTLVGWISNKDKSEWGCFKAFKKIEKNSNLPTFVKVRNGFQNNLVQDNNIQNFNKILLGNKEMINLRHENIYANSFNIPFIPNHIRINDKNQPRGIIENKIGVFPVNQGIISNGFDNFIKTPPSILIAPNIYYFKQIEEDQEKKKKNHLINKKNEINSSDELKILNKNKTDSEIYKFNKEYVKLLNNIEKSWEAQNYKDFMFPLNERKLNKLKKIINEFLHERSKDKNLYKISEKKGYLFSLNSPKISKSTNERKLKKESIFSFKSLLIKDNQFIIDDNNSKIKYLPKSFNWLNLVRPSAKQGNCGSCYAISTLRMAEARLKLLYNHNVQLSVQHVLDCSIYNQGCDGGYSYLVMKFANEFELVPESCKPYTTLKSKCETGCNLLKVPYIYRMLDYKYLGGSYGKCDEFKMMEELKKNGPFVVSFESDVNFMYYKSGIYHSLDSNNEIGLNFQIINREWTKVDHSVLLVGWGEDEITKEKYWILQNTWGTDWGEDGFFRVRRGVNEMGIESTCEVGTPIIFDNLSNMPIIPKDNKYIPKSYSNYIEKILQSDSINRYPAYIPKEKKNIKDDIEITDLKDEILKDIKFFN